jgi:hypothetical protein
MAQETSTTNRLLFSFNELWKPNPTAFSDRRAKQFQEAEIENDFQQKCRKGSQFAAYTAF